MIQMENKSEKQKQNPENQVSEPGQRKDDDQPITLPGIKRYHFFSNLRNRPLTINLNRLAMLGLGTVFAADVVKAVSSGNPQTIYCYECRACYATQDKCPVGISRQAELTVSSRVKDYVRFLKADGLKCIRCGNCASFCVINLDLPKIFSLMQQNTIEAMNQNKIPRHHVLSALKRGSINRQYINDVAAWIGKFGDIKL